MMTDLVSCGVSHGKVAVFLSTPSCPPFWEVDGLIRTWAVYWPARRFDCSTYRTFDGLAREDIPINRPLGYFSTCKVCLPFGIGVDYRPLHELHHCHVL